MNSSQKPEVEGPERADDSPAVDTKSEVSRDEDLNGKIDRDVYDTTTIHQKEEVSEEVQTVVEIEERDIEGITPNGRDEVRLIEEESFDIRDTFQGVTSDEAVEVQLSNERQGEEGDEVAQTDDTTEGSSFDISDNIAVTVAVNRDKGKLEDVAKGASDSRQPKYIEVNQIIEEGGNEKEEGIGDNSIDEHIATSSTGNRRLEKMARVTESQQELPILQQKPFNDVGKDADKATTPDLESDVQIKTLQKIDAFDSENSKLVIGAPVLVDANVPEQQTTAVLDGKVLEEDNSVKSEDLAMSVNTSQQLDIHQTKTTTSNIQEPLINSQIVTQGADITVPIEVPVPAALTISASKIDSLQSERFLDGNRQIIFDSIGISTESASQEASVTFLKAGKKEPALFDSINLKTHLIQVVQDEKRIVITSRQDSTESNTDLSHEQQEKAIESPGELAQAVTHSLSLLSERSAGAPLRKDGQQGTENETPQEIAIIVSPELLEFIRKFQSQNELQEKIPTDEEMKVNRPVIFSTGNELDPEIKLSESQIEKLQEVLSVTLKEDTGTMDNDTEALKMVDSTDVIDLVRNEGKVVISARKDHIESTQDVPEKPDVKLIDSTTELKQAVAHSLMVSGAESLNIAEESQNAEQVKSEVDAITELTIMVTPELLEFIEGLELKDDGLETKNEEDTTTEYPIIFSTGEESGQLILTDKEVRKLQVVLSLSVQKDAVPTSVEDRHLKASDEFEDTIMSIIQTVTTEEKIENTVIPLEDEVFTLIQEGINTLEMQDKDAKPEESKLIKNNTQKEFMQTVESGDIHGLVVVINSQGEEITIDIEALKKLLEIHKKNDAKLSVIYSNDELAPEEIVHDNTKVKRGYIQSEWFDSQAVLFAISLLSDRSAEILIDEYPLWDTGIQPLLAA